jgi:hypothetical protein
VVAVATLGLPLDGQNQPDARPGVEVHGVGHGEHLADGVASLTVTLLTISLPE